MDQSAKAQALKALHEGREIFVIANASDAGSARLFAAMGFKAIATTSAGLAFALGRQDGAGEVPRAEVIANAAAIAAAVELPVSADLENGYGDRPEDAAETIRAAAEAGCVGGSIEDATSTDRGPIYDFGLAVERVAAAAEAARALPFPFQFVARAENFLNGRPDLDDTIRRLQAYEAAGADVLFAPGLPNIEAVRTVCASVTKPVNAIISAAMADLTIDDYAAAGVRRISLGSSFARAAFQGLRAAGEEVRNGRFTFAKSAIAYGELQALMKR